MTSKSSFKAQMRRNAIRRKAERHMLEQATLRHEHEHLLAAAKRVVEAWESTRDSTDLGDALDSACRDLATVVD